MHSCMCVWRQEETGKRVEGQSIIIYMAPPLAWVLPWQHNGCRLDNRVTVVMKTPGNCWCQCSKVCPKVPLGWSGCSYRNAHIHPQLGEGKVFGIWEVFELLNNERRSDGKWKKELQRVSERERLRGNCERAMESLPMRVVSNRAQLQWSYTHPFSQKASPW